MSTSQVPEGMPEALDKRNSPAAGTGADVISSGQGYMTTPIGAGPGFGKNNEASAHNTGIGVSGAGTGSSGYHHGAGGVTDPAGAGELSTNKEDAHKLKNLLHLHHRKH
ncbi:hypothetical protein WJX79_002508 [Trebouxia sp. C0005]